jgi:hypothetical protein
MTPPRLTGDPAALWAAANTLTGLADDLRARRSQVVNVRSHLAGTDWQGPAALAFDQGAWFIGGQLGTAADHLEAAADAIGRYADRLAEELDRYSRAMAVFAEQQPLAEAEAGPSAGGLRRAEAAALDAYDAAHAAADRCAEELAAITGAAAMSWRDWTSFTTAAIPAACFSDMRLASVWDRRRLGDPDRLTRPWFPPGSDVVGYDIPMLPGYGQVRMGFFIADEEVELTPWGPVIGDGNGRDFDPAMRPEDNKVYVEIDYEAGRAWVGSMPSCSDATETNCTPSHQIDDDVHLRAHDSGAVELEFSLGNSRADGPILNNLEISGDLVVIPLAGGAVQLGGTRSPFPSFEAYHDRAGTTVTLARKRQTDLGPLGLAVPDESLDAA